MRGVRKVLSLKAMRTEVRLRALDGGVLGLLPDTSRASQRAAVTDELFGRLDDVDIRAVRAVLAPEERDLVVEPAADVERKRATLHLGVFHRVRSVIDKTLLVPDTPPDSIHAMGRGPLAAGGSLYYADLVVGAWSRVAPSTGPNTVLDFGCSSGRVVRVLRSYWRSARLYGCDPNADAIGWARSHLPGIEFFDSAVAPPLGKEAGTFDLIFAISIWSHFGSAAGLAWLSEMHRLLKPNGILVLTMHGPQSLAYYRRERSRPGEFILRSVTSLGRNGFHFEPVFGPAGDWGVIDDEWGEAYISLDWLASHLAPTWALLDFQMGAVENNQDVVVLGARAG